MKHDKKKFLTIAIGQSILVLSGWSAPYLMAAENTPAPVKLAAVSTSHIESSKGPKTLLALAKMYQVGEGVQRNPARAFDFYRRAARMGNAEAQYQLALMYLDSYSVNTSEDKAMKWLERATAQGHRNAKFTYNYLLNNTFQEGC